MPEGRWGLENRSEGDDFENVTIGRSRASDRKHTIARDEDAEPPTKRQEAAEHHSKEAASGHIPHRLMNHAN
jgi:hypothetical protein